MQRQQAARPLLGHVSCFRKNRLCRQCNGRATFECSNALANLLLDLVGADETLRLLPAYAWLQANHPRECFAATANQLREFG